MFKRELQILVYDDVLDENDRHALLEDGNTKSKNGSTFWGDFSFGEIESNPYEKLVCIAGNNFDLTAMVGYEYWYHYQSRPHDWHQDLHQELYKATKIIKTSLVSMAYYPLIDNVTNGNFLSENGITVKPKTNRLVIFKGDLSHLVEEFTGNRNSVAINVWDEKIKDYHKNSLKSLYKKTHGTN